MTTNKFEGVEINNDNMDITTDADNNLVIKINLNRSNRPDCGMNAKQNKVISEQVGTTRGNIRCGKTYDGKSVSVGVNAYCEK